MAGRKASVIGIIALIMGISGLGLGGYSLYINLTSTNEISIPEDNQPITRVYRSTDYNLSTIAWIIVDFDTIEIDLDDNFNITTNRFNCSKAGYYLISGQVSYYPYVVGEAVHVAIYKNSLINKATNVVHASNTGIISASVVDVINMTEGDTIDLRVYHTSGVSETIYSGINGAYTFLSIAFIGNPDS
ncbi:MAG: C1q-like domain-containing protein [Promethearchaeota archaeon]